MEQFLYKKGSAWRRWDLQAQTILDDGYTPLSVYYQEFKAANPDGWYRFIAQVGGEANALLYDSKAYFSNAAIPKADRCVNYVRNLLAFVEVFNPELRCLGITDHNYFDDCLLDTFIEYGAKSRCKVLPGVEINCQGIHM